MTGTSPEDFRAIGMPGLSVEEERVLSAYWSGDALPLAQYLQAGNVPSVSLAEHIGLLIEDAHFDRLPSPKARGEKHRTRARDLMLGAWFWVRLLHLKGATIESIEAEVATNRPFGATPAIAHRAYLKFKKRAGSEDALDGWETRTAFHRALREFCEECGADYYDQQSRLYSVQNLDLILRRPS